MMYSGLAMLVIGAIIAFALLRGDDDPTATTPVGPYGEDECPAEDGSSPRQIDFTDRQPLCIDQAVTYTAVFDTSEGEVRVTLDTAATPITTNNFVTLARWGYYDDTTLFRTDTGIDIIQGGSPHTESAGDPGPGYSLPDEPTFDFDGAGLAGTYSYEPGQLVMARTAVPDGASAQFFFTTGPLASLLDASGNFDGTGTYVTFGATDDDGLAVLQAIIGLDAGGGPSRTVTINSVTILEG